MCSSATEPRTADHFVHKATDFPQPIAVIPAVLSTYPPNIFQNGVLIFDFNGFFVSEHTIFGHLDVVFEVFLDLSAGNAVFPTADHEVLFNFFEGQVNGLFVGVGFNAQHLLQPIVFGYDFHLHAVHQVHCQFVGGGGNKIEPIGRQFGGHHGNRENPIFKTTDFGVAVEHILIGKNIWPANIKRLVVGFCVAQDLGQELDHIPNGNGLCFGKHPLWCDHHGQFFAEIAYDFKRGTARAYNDPGTEHGKVKRAFIEDFFHIFS